MRDGSEVYVNRLGRSGRARVVRTRRDGRVVVRFHDGTTARVRSGDVTLAERKNRVPAPVTVQRGTRAPVSLVPQPKPHTPRDRPYLDWLRTQPCAACSRPPPCDPSHHGRGGVGIKAPDHDAIPLCRSCHNYWHDHRRIVGRTDLDKPQTSAWLETQARRHRAEFGRQRDG